MLLTVAGGLGRLPPPNPDEDTLETYALPDASRASTLYTMTVSQGTPESCPVLYSTNPFWSLIDGSNVGLTRRNHWTQFSFTGDPVEIVVSLPSASVASAVVRAGSWSSGGTASITPTINTGAHTITFTITTPGQYFVYIPSKAVVIGDGNSGDPLFIFASVIDTDVPVVNGTTIVSYDPDEDIAGPRSGASIVVFPEGAEYNLDPDYVDGVTPAATAFQLDYGQEVYIHGGAYVHGKIAGINAGTGVLKIRGRGTLSGEQYLAFADLLGNEIAINIASRTTTGCSVYMSGITIMDAARKNCIINDASFSIYDVKAIGITGDFVTMTNGGQMDMCFTKLNDDHMKFFSSNATTTNHTCYLQKAGPGAHCSWQVTGAKSNNTLDGLHCVGADRPNLSPGSIGVYTQFISNSLVICTNLGSTPNAGHLTDYTFRNVTSDVEVYMAIGMWIAWDLTGFTDGLGDLDGFVFEDWDVPAQATFSYFNGNGTSAGTITNFHINRVFIGGVKVTSANRATYFKWAGNDGQATFTYT